MLARMAVSCLLLMLATAVSAQDKEKARAGFGDYAVTLTEVGALIAYKGEAICIGSYLAVFNPGYKGTLVSSREGWKDGQVAVSADGRTVTLEAKLPKGRFTYSATVTNTGVRTTTRVFVAEGAEVGPVECAAFQIPTSLVQGGSVEVVNAAGMPIDSQPIPAVGKRGPMARHGEALTIKTPTRNIVIASLSPAALYPFDARVDQYAKQQGI
ncbi:MAG: hypothetical protein FJ279_18990, partial [Planctomycetes bacterium]|nr:hypothetical protein [Planctomycetota bacterium]